MFPQYRHTSRQRLTTSPWLLVWGMFFSSIVWTLPTPTNLSLWAGFGVVMVCTFLAVEWNTQASLLRVRSRLTSTSLLFLLTIFPQFHDFGHPLLLCTGMLVIYLLLFQTYQNRSVEGYVFYAFLLLSLGSLSYLPLIWLSLPLLVCQIVFLRSFSLRTFCASLFGLLLPYIYVLGYALWQGNMETIANYDPTYFLPESPCYDNLPCWQVAGYAYVVLLSFPAMIYFLRNIRAEKRRTVMYFGMIITQTLLLLILLPLQPQAFLFLFPLLLVNISPLVAHLYVLSKSRVTNVWFVITFWLGVLLGLLNYCDLWTLFSTSL